jgi:hypothetical protein
MSKVQVRGDAWGEVEASLDLLASTALEAAGPEAARTLVRRAERLARKVRAVQIDALALIEDQGHHLPDGHASGRVLVAHVGHLSEPEGKRRDRARRMLAAMPMVQAGLREGRIGSCQVDRIALVWVNPRVQAEFERLDAQVALLAAMLPYEELDRRLKNWVAQVDEDGTADRARRCHENRRARLVQEFDGGWELLGGFGSLSGARMKKIHQAFAEAEFQADWAEAREIHGDATTVAHLARTYDQRDADAMERIFEIAATAFAATPGVGTIDTTIVMDQETFERELRRALGQDLEPRPVPDLDLLPTDPDPCDDHPGIDAPGEALDHEPMGLGDADASRAGLHPGRQHRCETLDGDPVDPTEAFANAVVGRVRRAVVGWDGVVLDMSGRHKLFTGAVREAVMLTAARCFWPGCRVKHRHCQADHLDPRRNGGRTNPDNGGPACGKHNRLKEHGFTARRDARGRMHVYRPDGTEIE